MGGGPGRIPIGAAADREDRGAAVAGAHGGAHEVLTQLRNVTLLGILWGGSGSISFVFSPLSNIEGELGALTTF